MLVWLRFLAFVFCGAVTVKLVGLIHHWRKLWVAMGLRSTPGVRKVKGVASACTRFWLGNDPRNHRHRVYYTYAHGHAHVLARRTPAAAVAHACVWGRVLCFRAGRLGGRLPVCACTGSRTAPACST